MNTYIQLVAQSCPTLCDPTDCSPPDSSVHWISQARILEWVAIPFSRGSSQPRDRTGSPALQADFVPSELQGSPSWTHTTNYKILNYGKNVQGRASCYITCNYQSRLSTNDPLDYANNLALKTVYPSLPRPLPPLAWPTSLLRCSLCSFFIFSKLSCNEWNLRFFVSLPRTKAHGRRSLQTL